MSESNAQPAASRRRFLTLGFGALGLTAVGGATWFFGEQNAAANKLRGSTLAEPATALRADDIHFFSAFSRKVNDQWQHGFGAFDAQGGLLQQLPLPARGHGVVRHPTERSRSLVFARRPGSYIYDIDMHAQTVQLVKNASDRRFYGHGCIDAQAGVLYSTENNFEQQRGVIAVRDLQTKQLLAEFDSGGVGPHECRLLPDNRTLVVANGGILTHPDKPRSKLNIPSMRPNLSYIDVKTGKVLGQYHLADHQLSIRHFDVSEQGKVVIGLQYEGDKQKIQPLIVTHEGENTLQPMLADELFWRKVNQYTASVSIDNANQRVGVTTPRGHSLSVWDLKSNELLNSINIRDCAGLAVRNSDFIVSNGRSELHKIQIDAQQNLQAQRMINPLELRWDNHMAS